MIQYTHITIIHLRILYFSVYSMRVSLVKKDFPRFISFGWIAIALIVFVFSGWYFRYRGQAGVTFNAPQVANETLASGLVGHWTFDGPDIDWDATNEILDQTTNNYDGNVGGSLGVASARLGRLGQALNFNGTSDYIDLGGLDVSGSAITIQAWIFVTDSSGFTDNDRIISKATGSAEADHYWMMSLYDNNTLRIRLRTGTTTTTFISEDNALQANVWQHVAFVYNGATVELYANGFDVGGGAKTGTLATSGAVNANIGRNPGSNGNYFPGIIDDVRIYSTALSASDILKLSTPGTALVNAPVEDPLSQGLLGYWKFDEGTGTSTTADSSGNGNSGTMTNMESGDWVAGKIGPYALAFDGSAERVSVSDPASGILDFESGEPFSVAFWFNPDSVTAQDDALVDKRSSGTFAGYSIQQYITDGISVTLYDGTDTCLGISPDLPSAGVWYHTAMTWKDSILRMYLDGELVDESTCPSVGDLSNAQPLAFGTQPDYDSPYSGKLDDIRIYGYPLSAGDVLKLYQTTAPAQPVDTSLVGHWTFDGPDIHGTTVMDRSSYGNDGVATGTTKTIGKLGQGLSFNGSSDYVSTVNGFTSLPGTTNTPFSFSFWIKANSGVSGDVFSWGIYRHCNINYAGAFSCTCSDDNYNGTRSYVAVDDGTWHQIAYIYISEGSQTLYTDGILVASASESLHTGTGDVGLGYTLFGGYAAVSLDDVRVYNRALSASEVTNLYILQK